MIAIIPISGFRQRNRHRIGMRGFWRWELRPLSSADVFVHPPVEWCRDPRDILGTVEDVGARELIVVCYSWGGGFGARRLVKEALSRGLTVRLVACCDAVWKSTLPRWAGWFLAPISMTGIPSIDFPAEVEKIVAVHQTQTRPAGHRIWHGKREVMRTKLNATHMTIDEHPKWMSIASEAIAQTLLKPTT